MHHQRCNLSFFFYLFVRFNASVGSHDSFGVELRRDEILWSVSICVVLSLLLKRLMLIVLLIEDDSYVGWEGIGNLESKERSWILYFTSTWISVRLENEAVRRTSFFN